MFDYEFSENRLCCATNVNLLSRYTTQNSCTFNKKCLLNKNLLFINLRLEKIELNKFQLTFKFVKLPLKIMY